MCFKISDFEPCEYTFEPLSRMIEFALRAQQFILIFYILDQSKSLLEIPELKDSFVALARPFRELINLTTIYDEIANDLLCTYVLEKPEAFDKRLDNAVNFFPIFFKPAHRQLVQAHLQLKKNYYAPIRDIPSSLYIINESEIRNDFNRLKEKEKKEVDFGQVNSALTGIVSEMSTLNVKSLLAPFIRNRRFVDYFRLLSAKIASLQSVKDTSSEKTFMSGSSNRDEIGENLNILRTFQFNLIIFLQKVLSSKRDPLDKIDTSFPALRYAKVISQTSRRFLASILLSVFTRFGPKAPEPGPLNLLERLSESEIQNDLIEALNLIISTSDTKSILVLMKYIIEHDLIKYLRDFPKQTVTSLVKIFKELPIGRNSCLAIFALSKPNGDPADLCRLGKKIATFVAFEGTKHALNIVERLNLIKQVIEIEKKAELQPDVELQRLLRNLKVQTWSLMELKKRNDAESAFFPRLSTEEENSLTFDVIELDVLLDAYKRKYCLYLTYGFYVNYFKRDDEEMVVSMFTFAAEYGIKVNSENYPQTFLDFFYMMKEREDFEPKIINLGIFIPAMEAKNFTHQGGRVFLKNFDEYVNKRTNVTAANENANPDQTPNPDQHPDQATNSNPDPHPDQNPDDNLGANINQEENRIQEKHSRVRGMININSMDPFWFPRFLDEEFDGIAPKFQIFTIYTQHIENLMAKVRCPNTFLEFISSTFSMFFCILYWVNRLTRQVRKMRTKPREMNTDLQDFFNKQELIWLWMEENINFIRSKNHYSSGTDKDVYVRVIQKKIESLAEGLADLYNDLPRT